MTDLEKEILRQIYELSREITVLRERVAILDSRPLPQPRVFFRPGHMHRSISHE